MVPSLTLVACALAAYVSGHDFIEPGLLAPAAVPADGLTERALGDGPPFTTTAGSNARCSTENIPISVNSENVRLLLSSNPTQQNVTQIFQELFQVNSNIVQRTTAGSFSVDDTFNIAATLCFPNSSGPGKLPSTIQILGHGVGLHRSYFDITPGNSYVEAAAQAGYATLAFDRLGVGGSDKPDPINVVQANVHVEVLHGLAQGLRKGLIGSQPFRNIVGVGSSFGGIVQIGASAKYPDDFDAVVISSVSDTLQFLPATILSNTPALARDDPSGNYINLPGAYLIDPTTISFQQPFFRYPFYSQDVFNAQYEKKGAYTLGDEFTLASLFVPAPRYTGPVDVVLGQEDYPFCMGDCESPADRAAAALSFFYPNRNTDGSQSYIVANCGHLINDHNAAGVSYQQINRFLQANNL